MHSLPISEPRRSFGRSVSYKPSEATRAPELSLASAIILLCFVQFDIIRSDGWKLNYIVALLPMLMGFIAIYSLRVKWKFTQDYAGILAVVLFGALVYAIPAGSDAILRFWLVLWSFGTSYLVATAIVTRRTLFSSAISLVLWINVCALIFQVTAYLFFGSIIDVHKYLFPFSRISQLDAAIGFGFPRFNGLQLETGTFAAMMGTLALISLALENRIKVVHVAVLGSLLLGRAASSVVFIVGLLVVFMFFSVRSTPRLWMLTGSAVALLASGLAYWTGFAEYLLLRTQTVVQGADGSASIKFANALFLASASPQRLLIGSGFMEIDCAFCSYVNSNGLWFSLVFFFGVTGAALILGLGVVATRRPFPVAVLIACLLMSRFTLYHPALWVGLLVALWWRTQIRSPVYASAPLHNAA